MKRIVTLILAVLTAAMVLPVSGLAAGTYTDVSDDEWYYAAVEDCADRGLMNGTGNGTFTPDGDLTRAMLVTVLWRLNGCPAPAETPAYSDVPAGQWYSDAIAWASAFRVVEGYGGGVFGTNDPVTREQMAVIFYRWAQGNGLDVTFTQDSPVLKEEADLGIYMYNETKDGTLEGGYVSANKAISDWAVEAVVWAAEHDFLTWRTVRGLDPMGGSYSSLCAPDTATRAEVAVFLSRFCRAYVDEGSGESGRPAATVPYTWDILTMDLPESWQGNYQANGDIGYDGVPLGRSITFWDLSNKMPRSSWGRLFDLVLWPVGVDSSMFGNWLKLGDFDYRKSGRICTVEVPGEGQLNLYVVYPETRAGDDGVEVAYYDKENPKNYVKMSEDIHDILRTIRFREDVKIISLADALSAPLSTKTGPLP